MRNTIIGALFGVAWLFMSYFTEPLFPLGDIRWAGAAIIAFMAAGICWKFWPERETNVTATRIMKAWRMNTVDKLFQTFVARSDKSEELSVHAAYALRHLRHGGTYSLWHAFEIIEEAVDQGVGTHDEVEAAIANLKHAFPEPWWQRFLRERRETEKQC